MIAFEGKIDYNNEVKPHIAAASESAANTIQKPKPYANKERMI